MAVKRPESPERLPEPRVGAGRRSELARRACWAEHGNAVRLASAVGAPASLAGIGTSALVAAQGRLRGGGSLGVQRSNHTTSNGRRTCARRGYERLCRRSSRPARSRNSLFVRA